MVLGALNSALRGPGSSPVLGTLGTLFKGNE